MRGLICLRLAAGSVATGTPAPIRHIFFSAALRQLPSNAWARAPIIAGLHQFSTVTRRESKQANVSTPSRSKGKAILAADRQGSGLPERLLIYHAGTGRITFLAMLKVTSIFLGAFFCFAVVPGYVSAGRLELEPIGLALCGILPMIMIGYTSAPFVTHMHIHLPEAARASRQTLERFVYSMPPSTPLSVTTMSLIGKPRYSKLQAGELRPRRKRFGLVNYIRDNVEHENASRRWYNLRAVGNFFIQDDKAIQTARKKSKGKRNPVDWWIWDALREKIAKRAVTAKVGA